MRSYCWRWLDDRIELVHVEDFFHSGPPLAFFALRERRLHGHHQCPPLLCSLVGGHFCHVGGVIGAVVLEIAEKHVVVKKDGVVAHIAGADCLQNAGPNGGMMFLVLLFGLGLEADHHSVSSHFSSSYTGSAELSVLPPTSARSNSPS